MSAWLILIMRVFRVSLAFYPARFRAEFGEEMQEVFASVLIEDQDRGGGQAWQLLWIEIRDWPGSVLEEHLRERRRKMFSNGKPDAKPLSRGELLAAMGIFVLPLISIVAGAARSNLPEWANVFAPIAYIGILLFALALAVVKGLPRWSLPYFGFAILLLLILMRFDKVFSWIYPIFLELFGPRSLWSIPIRIFYTGLFGFTLLASLILSAFILVCLIRLLPHTRSVWQSIRSDWTQLSFLFYGGLVYAAQLAFDEYHFDSIWKLMAWTCLGLGAWQYLQRAKGLKQRITALLGGATGAMWVIALAKWVLIPMQKWPTGYPVSPSVTTRWTEVGGALVGWVMILMLLGAPALLNLLPPGTGPNVQSETTAA